MFDDIGLGRAIIARLRLAFREERSLGGERPAGSPIVLLPGFAGSNSALRPLSRYLEHALKRPVVSLHLGLGTGDIRRMALRVDAQLAELSRAPDFEYADIVGHSLGGLVAAYVLKHNDRGRRVRRVVTLGSPHRGTPKAWWGVVTLGLVSPSMWQMLPHRGLLRWLEAAPVPPGSELVAVAALEDTVVPPRFAVLRRLPGHSNRGLPGVGHFGLIFSRAAFRLVVDALKAPTAAGEVVPLPARRARPVHREGASPDSPKAATGSTK